VGVGAFACVVGLVIVALAFRRSPALKRGGDAEAVKTRPVWLAVATLAGFCGLLPWIGYPLAALLFVGTLLLQLGAGWKTALLAAVLSAEGSYYLFATLLGVLLPQGLWPH
jgi:hypothetical protein